MIAIAISSHQMDCDESPVPCEAHPYHTGLVILTVGPDDGVKQTIEVCAESYAEFLNKTSPDEDDVKEWLIEEGYDYPTDADFYPEGE